MKTTFALVTILAIASMACKKSAHPPAGDRPDHQANLIGKYIVIQFSRSALGLAGGKPISREVDTSDGIRLTLSGYVMDQTDTFLLIGQHKEHGKNEGTEWIPFTSILAISEPANQNRIWGNSSDSDTETTQAWQFDAVKSLSHMVGIKIPRKPAGHLRLWIDRNGEQGLLGGTTIQDVDQWLYIGIDPATSDALFASFATKENPRGGIAYFHSKDLLGFRSQVSEKIDWTKPSLIALEANGEGKIYAQIAPDN